MNKPRDKEASRFTSFKPRGGAPPAPAPKKEPEEVTRPVTEPVPQAEAPLEAAKGDDQVMSQAQKAAP